MSTLTTRILRRTELHSDTPLAAAVHSFFVSVSGDISPKTRDFYQTGLDHFGTWAHQALQREPIISDLNPDYVGAFKTYIATQPTDKYPEGSIFRARAAIRSLKRLASWLAEEGSYVGRDGQSALRRVKMPKEPQDVRQPLSDEQLEHVRRGAGNPGSRDYTIVVLAAGTGLRRGELRLLKVGSVDLIARRLKVIAATSKVRRPRWVDFHDSVARDVDRYLRTKPIVREDDVLFPADHGDAFTIDGIGKLFDRISAKAGVRFSVHILRHTWATNCRLNGMDLLTLKEQGGWTRWEMVERYAHIIPLKDRTVLPDSTAAARKAGRPRKLDRGVRS